MSTPPTSYVEFTTSMTLDELQTSNPDFYACVTGEPTQECDSSVGSLLEQTGWCSDPTFQQTVYCACVNNTMECPMFTSTYCANTNAYRPTAMVAPSGEAYAACKGVVFCNNIVDTYGSQNVVTGVTQQCGSTVQAVTNTLQANVMLVAVIFILLIAFLGVAATSPSTAGENRGTTLKTPDGPK